MSKTIDELQSVFEAAFTERLAILKSLDEFAWTKEVETECIRAGIRVVVMALRDEFSNIMHHGDDWNRHGIVGVFNEILGDKNVKD